MKRRLRFFSLFFVLLLVLSGCGKSSDLNGKDGTDSGSGESTEDGSVEVPDDVSFAEDDSELFTDRDYRDTYEESGSIHITMKGSSVSCDSDAVQISGTTVQITEEATYILSGTLDDGRIVVNAEDTAKLQLVLDGASITSETSAALYILEADKVFVTLAEDSKNTLANGGTFTAVDENNIDGAVFSKQDLTFNGSGALTVTSPAGHGIVCKDDLVFTGGTYTVNAAAHGLDANDSVRVVNASLTVDAGKDGIHAENSDDSSLGFVYVSSGSFQIEAEGDGISAIAYLQVNEGSLAITAGGGSVNGTKSSSDSYGGFMGGRPGSTGGHGGQTTTTEDSTSMKGMKAAGNMQIAAGTFTIDSADDAVHSNGTITVTGGAFTIATGDDGFHADEALHISGGTIAISESYEGLEALHVQVSGGEIAMVATDDGVNAAGGTDSSGTGGRGGDQFGGRGGMGGMGSGSSDGSIVISGGTLEIQSSGDGMDANGTLEITGGFITVCGPTQGDTATLDYDISGTITGGTFIGTGSSMMAQTFSDSEQGVITLQVGNQTAGTKLVLKDSSGKTLLSAQPELSYAVVILSSPELVKGEKYTLSVGTSTGEYEAQ